MLPQNLKIVKQKANSKNIDCIDVARVFPRSHKVITFPLLLNGLGTEKNKNLACLYITQRVQIFYEIQV